MVACFVFVCFFCQAILTNTELTTLKARHQREVTELKENVHRANMASDRDQALREKVFNDAKAEVIALSKKVGSDSSYPSCDEVKMSSTHEIYIMNVSFLSHCLFSLTFQYQQTFLRLANDV